jgi:multicomponent Na+:H+ antiporter subunit D
MFALPALSLAGLPPWGGFVAKLGLARAGVLDGQHAIVAVSLAVSLLTLYSMSKIWMGAFWGEPDERPDADPIDDGVDGGTFGMVGPTVVIVLAGVAMAVWAGPLWELAERAAVELLDKAAVEQVSGAGS